ncbi:AMP-binding protein [Bradyrhizobium manausense]|uniref:AMP-binding protein n=1 Tax=Bradyrhizobium manausense TaxID=989370 RepID=UPI00138F576C|nr:AMP-binding protein [Bradyrhizobium manausense]
MNHAHTDDYLAQWNEPLLIDYLDEATLKHPDRDAIIDFEYGTSRELWLSFRELRHRVDQIASNLIGLGVKRGDVVSCSCRTGGISRGASGLPAGGGDDQSVDADFPRARPVVHARFGRIQNHHPLLDRHAAPPGPSRPFRG